MSVDTISATSLINFFKLPSGTTVSMTGAEIALGVHYGYLANFEGPFIIMSTGDARDASGPNTSSSQYGTDLPINGVPGDKLTITFTIPKPVSAAAITFDFTFLSEEYPEWVGNSYNDYFSVKVNGVQAALDTNGREISINNNFFTGLSPTGTPYDGQTPPLKITAPIASEATTVEIVLEIADVGDGIYDSAAFIKNLGFVLPQKVFVDFDAGYLPFASLLGTGFNLPGSGLSEDQQVAIIASLNDIYKDFMIEFTQTKPASGEYSTIHVGGTVKDLPSYLKAPAGLLGRASQIDYGNTSKSDSAFVLAGEIPSNVALITQVIAHEAGHILGLRHIIDSTELMFPFAGSARTSIGGSELMAEIVNGSVVPVGGTQDSYNELVRNLGLKNSSKLVVSETAHQGIAKFFNFSFDSTLSKIYDVKIVVANQDNEIIKIIDAGDMKGDGYQELVLPAAGDDKIVVLGKTKNNGKYDVFVTPAGTKSFNLAKAGEIGLLEALGIEVSDLGKGTHSVAKAGSNGALTKIGSVSASAADSSGATPGPDVLTGENNKKDVIAGLAGDDLLIGLSGNDKLFGNTGNDTLRGGAGKDTLDGGAGKDTADYSDATAKVTVHLADASKNKGFAKGDVLIKIENLEGSNFADKLTGNSGANLIVGGDGKDTLEGGAGKDTLAGGAGQDKLSGGSGKDVFLFNTQLSLAKADKITDFNVKDDTIHLDDAVFAQLVAGPLAKAAFHKSKTGEAHDADDRIIYETDTGKIFYDADGNGSGARVLIATIGTNLALTHQDFAIV